MDRRTEGAGQRPRPLWATPPDLLEEDVAGVRQDGGHAGAQTREGKRWGTRGVNGSYIIYTAGREVDLVIGSPLSRRSALRLLGGMAATLPASEAALFATPQTASGARVPGRPQSLTREIVAASPGRVVPHDPEAPVDALRLTRQWDGPLMRSQLTNTGARPVRVAEVVLADVEHHLDPGTRLYGEGFQMLSQTGGTLGAPVGLGNYTDRGHYRAPMPDDAETCYGLLTLAPPGDQPVALAFGSCHRFSGQFYRRPGSLQAVCDTEGLELGPGQTWVLEELLFLSGGDRDALLERVAERLARNHPPLGFPRPPGGWCSWYCFGPDVTARQVLDNLDFIAGHIPELAYVQIDDGYQPFMGDWLDTGTSFGGDVEGVLRQIRERGFEPAIWVAPFIAEAGSRVFREHPDWFVQGDDGAPLSSEEVTFRGWRRYPWYVLDGTHDEVQRHLERVFRTLREEWGCSYFKLDANTWGAMHGGHRHDPGATRIEAYRRGMEAVLRGAGDAFVLGCNHPIWASVGLVHGSRSSNDITREWGRVATVARQNLMRNWQNGRLWWNDPDAVVLAANRGRDLTPDEYLFHATATWASGGMILSGDDLTAIPRGRLQMLRALLPPTGAAARFGDDSLRVGEVELPGARAFCLLNWEDEPRTLAFRLDGPYDVRELWSGEERGRLEGEVSTTLRPRSGRILVCRPA
jgi:alpha-galactosidase